MHAKAKGAYNLDKASRGLKHLEHFVMWSSFVSVSGNEGMRLPFIKLQRDCLSCDCHPSHIQSWCSC